MKKTMAVGEGSVVVASLISIAILCFLAFVAHVVARQLLLRLVKKLVSRTKFQWDDALLKHHFFDRLAQVAPGLILYITIPAALEFAPSAASFTTKLTLFYIVIIGVLVIDAFLNAAQEVYRTREVSKSFSITSFLQIVKVLSYALALILTFAIVLEKSPTGILAGLGAMSAVTMLVFKDAILGFVAGLQLSANRMVAAGDWIEVPSHGIDGDVTQVGLTTVKIKNFDNTISTLPTHALISSTFKNWRGMSESGGRRIKRAVKLDMTSVKFCDQAMLRRFSKIRFISDYLKAKKAEVAKHNKNSQVDTKSLVNGRRLTNLGTFRAYVEAYLKNHPQINQKLTFLVRQLPPSETGIAIEIYVFCKDKRWVPFEGIISDIFDHFLAVIPEFDLRVFQSPTGSDLRAGLSGKKTTT
ncbi:MAG: mechanosensitive ion channel family protein [Limisphaerales bacterium]